MQVEQGTAADVGFILGWLKTEHDADGEGFWSNRSMIAEAVDEQALWVIRNSDGAVASLGAATPPRF